MKTLTLMAIYVASFITIFLMLSLVGYVFGTPYMEIIHSQNWQVVYSIFFGWWLPIFPCREYYLKYEAYFDEVI